MTGLLSVAGLLGYSLAAALGGVSRFWLERWSVRRFGEHWPWGTLVANLAGSLLLGLLAGAIAGPVRPEAAAGSQLGWLVGASYCAAFTTFGGFIGQTFHRLRHRPTRFAAVIYLLGTGLGAVALFAVGFLAAG